MDGISKLAFSISATSRPPRGEEQHARDYYFLSQKEFDRAVEDGKFLEWEQVYPGQCYGTLEAEVERLWKEDKVVIFDVDVVGGLNLKSKLGSAAFAVFIQPPGMEALESRLRGRGTETEEKIQMRLKKASREMESAKHFDFILVNDELDRAVQEGLDEVNQFISS
jgi:guanylate kinase